MKQPFKRNKWYVLGTKLIEICRETWIWQKKVPTKMSPEMVICSIFNRKYIFNWWSFRWHASFRVVIFTFKHTKPKQEGLTKGHLSDSPLLSQSNAVWKNPYNYHTVSCISSLKHHFQERRNCSKYRAGAYSAKQKRMKPSQLQIRIGRHLWQLFIVGTPYWESLPKHPWVDGVKPITITLLKGKYCLRSGQ